MRRHRLFFSNDSIIIKRHMAPRSNQHTHTHKKKVSSTLGPCAIFVCTKRARRDRPSQPTPLSFRPKPCGTDVRPSFGGMSKMFTRHSDWRRGWRMQKPSSCAVSSSTPARARNSAGAAIVARGDRRIVNGKWRFIQKSTGGEMVSLMMLS